MTDELRARVYVELCFGKKAAFFSKVLRCFKMRSIPGGSTGQRVVSTVDSSDLKEFKAVPWKSGTSVTKNR